MRQPLEFIIAVLRPTQIRSVPTFSIGFSWHIDIDTSSVPQSASVRPPRNKNRFYKNIEPKKAKD